MRIVASRAGRRIRHCVEDVVADIDDLSRCHLPRQNAVFREFGPRQSTMTNHALRPLAITRRARNRLRNWSGDELGVSRYEIIVVFRSVALAADFRRCNRWECQNCVSRSVRIGWISLVGATGAMTVFAGHTLLGVNGEFPGRVLSATCGRWLARSHWQ